MEAGEKGVNLNNTGGEALSKFDTLEKTIETINKNRKLTAITSYVGLIVIIITLAIFITNWLSFFNNYNTSGLVKEVELRIPDLMNSEGAQSIYTTVQAKLVPQYTKALMQEFKNKAPLFAQDIHKEKSNLAQYLQTNVKNKIASNMVEGLSKTEATNLAAYFKKKLPPEKLHKISGIVHNVIQEKLTSELNKQLSPAVAQLNDINNSFEDLYQNMEKEGEFKNMSPQTIGEIENRFIEVLLESIIFEINPQKGNAPAEQPLQ